MRRVKLNGGSEKYALVSDEDYDTINTFKWHVKNKYGSTLYAHSTNYLATQNGRKVYFPLLMHRVIALMAGWPSDMDVDHRDGDGLNNQRENLRVATASQNRRNVVKYRNNKSGFKGVVWVAANCKWKAQITIQKRTIYLGSFIDPIEAARVYDEAALKYFGEFANTNFKALVLS